MENKEKLLDWLLKRTIRRHGIKGHIEGCKAMASLDSKADLIIIDEIDDLEKRRCENNER